MEKLKSIKILLPWMWKIWKGYRLQAGINALIGITLVATDLVFVWGTKLCIDIATHKRADIELSRAFILLLLIILIQIALSFASRWVKALLGVKSQNKMQRDYFAHLLSGQWTGVKAYHSGDLLNRLEKDVNEIVSFLTESLPALLTTTVQMLGAFAFLFVMDRTLACIIIVLIPVFLVTSKLYVKKTRKLTHAIRKTDSRIQSVMQEGVQHLTVIKTLEKANEVIENFSNIQGKLRSEVREKTIYSSISALIMNVGFSAGYMFTFIWGVSNLEKGAITYGALMAFMQLVGQIQGPARSLTQFIPIFISAFTAGERLMEIENIKEEQNKKSTPIASPTGLRVQHLMFSYADGSRKIFEDFSYDFKPGSITAIQGETGEGKTTLVRLMLALISPNSGCIELYNETSHALASAETRCNFAYVPQGNTLLSGTIRSNLLMGNPKATEEQMKEALRTACADFVFSLPKGLETPCGEGGDGLSEGQAQRISIARAILKSGGILLLDEATSALDEQTERMVINNLLSTEEGRTLIFVTHRPALLEHKPDIIKLVRPE